MPSFTEMLLPFYSGTESILGEICFSPSPPLLFSAKSRVLIVGRRACVFLQAAALLILSLLVSSPVPTVWVPGAPAVSFNQQQE